MMTDKASANGAKEVVAGGQSPVVHVYKMSDEVDELFAGDLSGKSPLSTRLSYNPLLRPFYRRRG